MYVISGIAWAKEDVDRFVFGNILVEFIGSVNCTGTVFHAGGAARAQVFLDDVPGLYEPG